MTAQALFKRSAVAGDFHSSGDAECCRPVFSRVVCSAAGILVCIATTFLATDLKPAKVIAEIENTLKMQLIVSTIIMTPVSYNTFTSVARTQFCPAGCPLLCCGSAQLLAVVSAISAMLCKASSPGTVRPLDA